MTADIRIFPSVSREDRDVGQATHGRTAEVVRFTPGWLRCTICGSDQHRAHSCKDRPRKGRPDY